MLHNWSSYWCEFQCFCQRAQNLSLPPWATQAVLDELSSLAGLDMSIMCGGVDYQYREKLAPYCAGLYTFDFMWYFFGLLKPQCIIYTIVCSIVGPLLAKLLENMDDKIHNRTTYNYIAYSAVRIISHSVALHFSQTTNWKLYNPLSQHIIDFKEFKKLCSADSESMHEGVI